MNKLKIAALLAFAGTGICTQTAQAATYAAGDVLIGFRSTSGSVTTDYMIDVGQALFTQAAAHGGTVTIGTFGSDLNSLDPNWFTDGTTLWGVGAGPLGSDNSHTLYAGYAETSPSTTPGSSYNGRTNASQTTQIGKYNTPGVAFGNGTNATGSPVGDTGGFNYPGLQFQLQTAANTSSWASTVDASAGVGFGQFNGFEGAIGTGSSGDFLDYYKIAASPSTPVLEGTFNLASDGTVSFSTPAPEPSSLVALLGGGGLLGMIRRRRAVRA